MEGLDVVRKMEVRPTLPPPSSCAPCVSATPLTPLPSLSLQKMGSESGKPNKVVRIQGCGEL